MQFLFDEKTSLEFGISKLPSLFLIDGEGYVQYKHVGFDGDGSKFMDMVRFEIEDLSRINQRHLRPTR